MEGKTSRTPNLPIKVPIISNSTTIYGQNTRSIDKLAGLLFLICMHFVRTVPSYFLVNDARHCLVLNMCWIMA